MSLRLRALTHAVTGAAFCLGLHAPQAMASSTAQMPDAAVTDKKMHPGTSLAPTQAPYTTLKLSRFTLDNPPPLLADVLHNSDSIKSVFDTEVPGVQGWVIVSERSPSQPQVIYTFRDGTHGFTGAMFGLTKGGNVDNLTPIHLKNHAPKADIDHFWAQLQDSHWVSEGASDDKAVSTIYGFFDANCIYCHMSWIALKPYMDAGLQVRWIPVGILGATSAEKAAAIFESEDPAAAMQAGHERWEQVGLQEAFPTTRVSGKVQDMLDANGMLMDRLGVRGTPAFAFKDSSGKVSLIPGMPRIGDIPEITGMSSIPNDNPKLDRFR